MPSRRSLFESACRIGVFALIGWLLGTTLIAPGGRRVDSASAGELAARLPAWTRSGGSVALHGDFASTPPGWAVDWLAALAHSGHAVSWSGSPPAVAISAEAAPEPGGGIRIDLSAPSGTSVVVGDDASRIDSVHIARFGATITTPLVVGPISALARNQTFSIDPPDSTLPRAVVVIGEAGWEGKFIADALEADGWTVLPRFSVAPNVEVDAAAVRPASPLTLDTSRVAAVVAVDTTVARYAADVARFVRDGGGLVLAGQASEITALGELSPGTLGQRTRPVVHPTDTISLGSTGLYPISTLKQDGVVLERRSDGVAVAARRIGAGRVIQVGYDDSWRWRMAGAPGSEEAHRAWWGRVVGSVAYVPSGRGAASAGSAESAPVARLVERLGAARAAPAFSSRRAPLDRRIFMVLIMVLLLAEWGSRRLRGLR